MNGKEVSFMSDTNNEEITTPKMPYKNYKSRSLSTCSTDSCSSASLSEDDIPIKTKKQEGSSGFSDFCVKDIRLKDFGRREIDFAEQDISMSSTFANISDSLQSPSSER